MISRDGKCAAMLRETRLFNENNLKFELCKTLIFSNIFLTGDVYFWQGFAYCWENLM